MSLAESKAAEIKAAQAERSIDRKWVLESKAVVRAAVPDLWEALKAVCSEEVVKFSKLVPAAATMSLQGEGNTFTVQTSVMPSVDLQVNLTELGIKSKLRTQRHSLGLSKEGKWTLYRLGTDSTLEPCFLDGDAELSPNQLADILLEPIFDTFY
jgi:hypothetical protein